MKLYIKKQHIYNIVFAAVLISSLVNMSMPSPKKLVSSPYISKMLVVIDAGHGSPDGGAVGSLGICEKDLNLAVAKKLGNLLQQSGAFVVYTRTDDSGISKDKTSSVAMQKRSDMEMRRKIRDTSNADMFISIHMNKFTDATSRGPQTFYNGSMEESKILAVDIQKCLTDNLYPQNRRHAKDSGDSIYLLNNTNIPGVLVECGFLSHPEEEKLLCSEEYQEKIAYAIYSGIIKYTNNIISYKEMH